MPRPADLKALVLSMAERYHEGSIFPMAARTGLSAATMDKWSKGIVKSPDITSLAQFAEAYQLEPREVIEIAMRPPRRRGHRGLTCLVAALLSTTAWGPAPASASASAIGSEPTAATTYYVKRRRRGYSLWGRGFPHPLSGYPRLTACAA